ncbi:MAG: hypothetical protein WBD31_30920 [Rubripirellula sp.]
MTQMLLFDSVAETNVAVVNVPVATPPAVNVPANKAPIAKSTVSESTVAKSTVAKNTAASANRVGQRREEGGLNHMGDLARLVLLRYDLVAKRREQMAARRRAK